MEKNIGADIAAAKKIEKLTSSTKKKNGPRCWILRVQASFNQNPPCEVVIQIGRGRICCGKDLRIQFDQITSHEVLGNMVKIHFQSKLFGDNFVRLDFEDQSCTDMFLPFFITNYNHDR